MADPGTERNKVLGATLVKKLRARAFDAYYCATKEEALQQALALIPKDDVISWGGSSSIAEIGLLDYVRKHFKCIDRDTAKTPEERTDIMRKALDGVSLVNPHGPHPSADITVLGVDKGTAIEHVAEKLGVAIEDTYAFGDGVNDVCMLEAAGHGVAMGNAVPETKAAAEYITTSIDQDGVYNGLKHYGLI